MKRYGYIRLDLALLDAHRSRETISPARQRANYDEVDVHDLQVLATSPSSCLITH